MHALTRCLLFAVPCFSLVALSTPDTSARSEEDDLQDLLKNFDVQVQKRFLDTSKGFGMGRVYYPRHRSDGTMHRFTPENPLEQESINRLENLGLDSVLYLGNPTLLSFDNASPEAVMADERPRDDMAVFLRGGFRVRPALQGPVTLTSAPERPVLAPPPADLLADARNAFVAADRQASVRFSHDGWDFVARPVRATNERCVRCHNTSDEATQNLTKPPRYKMGDMLGVILYGTRLR